MEELTDMKEYLKASNADGTAILEAVTDWCSNCKAIAPFMDKMMSKYPDARFYTYNTDTALAISQELGARQVSWSLSSPRCSRAWRIDELMCTQDANLPYFQGWRFASKRDWRKGEGNRASHRGQL